MFVELRNKNVQTTENACIGTNIASKLSVKYLKKISPQFTVCVLNKSYTRSTANLIGC